MNWVSNTLVGLTVVAALSTLYYVKNVKEVEIARYNEVMELATNGITKEAKILIKTSLSDNKMTYAEFEEIKKALEITAGEDFKKTEVKNTLGMMAK